MAQQDDYYYEIQLTNKQLVFYFMAGATGLILSFLAGVMVGRGVDTNGGEVQAARAAQEDRIVAEETPQPAPSPTTDGYSYAKRLEADKPDEGLASPEPARPGRPSRPPSAAPAAPTTTLAAAPPPVTTAPASRPRPNAAVAAAAASAAAAPARPQPSPSAPPSPLARVASAARPESAPPAPSAAAAVQRFTIQYGAFKDRKSADKTVADLKAKGLPAYTVAGAQGLVSVRVGHYSSRDEAVTMKAKVPGTPFVIPE